MSEVTLNAILEEMRAGFAKVEAKADDRMQLIKQEFQSVRADIDERFDKVDATLTDIATQTAKVSTQIADHERRIKKLEGPNA
jgi:septal ring factor EnvC (AmiA/AmiB activator)